MQACHGVVEIRQRDSATPARDLHRNIGQPDDNSPIDEINEQVGVRMKRIAMETVEQSVDV